MGAAVAHRIRYHEKASFKLGHDTTMCHDLTKALPKLIVGV
jgi:hypothetical protein